MAWGSSSALVFFGLFASASAVPDISDADTHADFRDFGHSDAERTCKWYGIGEGEYCCPHAKHCLKPVRGKTCAAPFFRSWSVHGRSVHSWLPLLVCK